MSTPEFDGYKVDHLFLLIGENPLPNYVAAKMLLNENGTIYLVHSTGTKSKADCLQRRLEPLNVEFISLEKKEADSHFIWNKIKNKVEDIAKKYPSHTFGLNYTGGTKAMSVHGYRGLFDALDVNNPKFSYLDARSLHMLIDKNNEAPKYEPVKMKVTFDELFNLHDLPWKENKKPTREPILADAAEDFLNAYLSTKPKNSIAEQWWKWCKEQLHPKTKDRYGFWRDENELEKIPGISLDNSPEKIIQILSKYKMLNSNNELSLQKSKKQGFNELSDFCAWLSGIWLEHYVLHQVQNISKQFTSIHESAMSFHIDDPGNSNDRYDRFEFDVAFMLDYQLFALSCTTARDK